MDVGTVGGMIWAAVAVLVLVAAFYALGRWQRARYLREDRERLGAWVKPRA